MNRLKLVFTEPITPFPFAFPSLRRANPPLPLCVFETQPMAPRTPPRRRLILTPTDTKYEAQRRQPPTATRVLKHLTHKKKNSPRLQTNYCYFVKIKPTANQRRHSTKIYICHIVQKPNSYTIHREERCLPHSIVSTKQETCRLSIAHAYSSCKHLENL